MRKLFSYKSLAFLSCLFLTTTIKAQTQAAPGTYQFRCLDIKQPLDVFTIDMLYFIESHRDSLADITLKIAPNMNVKIFSYKTINDPSFVPVNHEPAFYKGSPDIYNEPEIYSASEEVKIE